jgi:hypothetical protein
MVTSSIYNARFGNKDIAGYMPYVEPVLNNVNALFEPVVNEVRAKIRLDVLTPESRLPRIPAKFSGNSKVHKLHSLTKSLKEARATFHKINEETRKRNEEARQAYLEIEKAHEKVKSYKKVSDAPKKEFVDGRERSMTKRADKMAEKMFRTKDSK